MNKAAISAAGFQPITRSPRRLIVNLQSIKKSVGKTRLALTAPKPLGYISVEIGSEEGPADAFIPEGMDSCDDIQIARVRMETPVYPNPIEYPDTKEGKRSLDDAISNAVQAVAAPALDQFYSAYYASIGNMRSTVVDTGSDLYQLMRLANFGRLEKIPQLAYGQLKRDYAKLFDDAFASTGNLIMIHHMKDRGQTIVDEKTGKDKWIATGVYEIDGSNVVTDKVQAVVEMWREDLKEADEETGMLVRFWAQIIDSRHSPASMGQTFKDFDVTFADIARKIFPNSKASDWE